ncbi:MAG: class II fructose-bisphosphate aldolase [bacterium]|nr:class II fructose-bisphosphate aldolase [bacterium]
MKTCREYIDEYKAEGKAIGHFNIATLDMLWGITDAARSLTVPVIIGLSEGERDFVGLQQAVLLVKSIRTQYDIPLFINADHTYSVERVKEAIDAGFDSVIFDGAQLSFEENIKATKECVTYARMSGRDVLVEGELGYIGTSSKLLDELPDNAAVTTESMTQPDEARQFVEETGVDLLAPAVGNVHGKLKHAPNPALDIGRIKEILQEARVPLVLHGGSGVSDADFTQAAKAGMNIIHVSTELRIAWKEALLQEITTSSELAAYRLLKPAHEAIARVATERLSLFNM